MPSEGRPPALASPSPRQRPMGDAPGGMPGMVARASRREAEVVVPLGRTNSFDGRRQRVMTDSSPAIENLLSEDRTFPPPEEFTANALVRDRSLYDRADQDFEAYWADEARKLRWMKEFTKVLEWDPPFAKWFSDGTLNVADNCLDRHVDAGGGDKVAYHFEGEPGDRRTITYAELRDEVARFANVLKDLGVGKGDRVGIYMGMIPELPVAMLACARIGAAHSVVFGGFSPDSLRDRMNDAEAKVLITQDGSWRG